jgi:dipeptidyl aminopeptidase/acylaminoacyl peptidase
MSRNEGEPPDSGLAPEDIYEYTEVREVAVSPDGERAAFVAHEFDEGEDSRRAGLFVVPTDGSRAPHRLTRASDASAPAWGPEGHRLGFLAARERDAALEVGPSEGGDEEDSGEAPESEGEREKENENGNDGDPRPQVWVFDLDLGGDARQVTDREEGVRGFDWGPDGERVVIDARDPTDEQRERLERRRDDGPIEVERLNHKADGKGWLDDVTSYLFVVDVETRESRRLDDAYGAGSFEPLGGLQPAWGPGERIAFVANHGEDPDDSGRYDLFTIDPDGGGKRKLSGGDVLCTAPTWSPDGERLACCVHSPPLNWYRPKEVYVADGSGRFESVSAGLDRTVSLLGHPFWTDEGTVLAPVGDGGRTRLVRCHAGSGETAERVFDSQGESRTFTVVDGSPGSVVGALTSSDAPADLHAVDVDGDESRRLTTLNGAFIEDHALPAHRRLEYENDDGERIEGIAFLPPGFDAEADAPDPHPTVVSVHGGPMAYDAPRFTLLRGVLCAAGYVVFCPNYRGSTSYGRAFSESLRGSRGDLETDDVTSGVDALVERGWADPDRLFLTGLSYGGITTAHVVARDDRFAAAAPEHGIYDFRSCFGTDDNHLWHEAEFGLPWENEERYRDISSISRVGDVETPLLITAGEEDWRCPPTQAEQLYVSVKKRGVPAKLVVYQDENHDVGDPERAIHRLESLLEWFERHDPTVDGGTADEEAGR